MQRSYVGLTASHSCENVKVVAQEKKVAKIESKISLKCSCQSAYTDMLDQASTLWLATVAISTIEPNTFMVFLLQHAEQANAAIWSVLQRYNM